VNVLQLAEFFPVLLLVVLARAIAPKEIQFDCY
jgi:hypothetical protein